MKPLSSTWFTSVFITICSLEVVQFVANLAMITAPKCSGLSHALLCVVEKKIKMLFTSLARSVRIGKNCARGLGYRLRPQAEGSTQDRGPRAVLKTQFFPIRTSRLVNNIYLCHDNQVAPESTPPTLMKLLVLLWWFSWFSKQRYDTKSSSWRLKKDFPKEQHRSSKRLYTKKMLPLSLHFQPQFLHAAKLQKTNLV